MTQHLISSAASTSIYCMYQNFKPYFHTPGWWTLKINASHTTTVIFVTPTARLNWLLVLVVKTEKLQKHVVHLPQKWRTKRHLQKTKFKKSKAHSSVVSWHLLILPSVTGWHQISSEEKPFQLPYSETPNTFLLSHVEGLSSTRNCLVFIPTTK